MKEVTEKSKLRVEGEERNLKSCASLSGEATSTSLQKEDSNHHSSTSTIDFDSSPTDRYPMTPDHLYVITELAKLGMAYLGLVLPEFAKEQENAGKDKRDHYAHLKSLYEVAGPETVMHFDEMCQFLYAKTHDLH